MDKKDHWNDVAKRNGLQAVMSQRWTDDECKNGTLECVKTIRSILNSAQVYPEKVLEVGCGIGRLVESVDGYQKYTGIDISEEMISKAKNSFGSDSVKFGVMDFSTFDDSYKNLGKFDLVYTCTVLEHVTDQAGWMNAVRKIKEIGKNVLLIEEIEDNRQLVWNEFDMIRSLQAYLDVMCDKFTLTRFERFQCNEDSYGAMLFTPLEKSRFE